jgi:hypothetical protein
VEEEINVNTPGPGGLHAETDYRRVFAEVLRGCFPGAEVGRVFPGVELEGVGVM